MQFKSWVSLVVLGQAALAVASPQAASQSLPPSPTGSGVCEPHGDHWHCHPTSTSAHDDDHHTEATGSCEPQGDHWHCPSGVPKPTTPPAQSTTGGGSTGTTGGVTGSASPSATGSASPSATVTAGAGRSAAPFGAATALASLFGAIFVGTLVL
ncbi:hypothetical protein O9K51_01406 [Purpureocillium lavendulum]|uniref:Uncharacterized protein n=1 Tax=Purpureocillium lavendulum TaxID=1247861 RepID=A0AB34G5T8_9HYPO|nr:hypothetical protein O9K51_01406 [Purpureocillium lavendulum]